MKFLYSFSFVVFVCVVYFLIKRNFILPQSSETVLYKTQDGITFSSDEGESFRKNRKMVERSIDRWNELKTGIPNWKVCEIVGSPVRTMVSKSRIETIKSVNSKGKNTDLDLINKSFELGNYTLWSYEKDEISFTKADGKLLPKVLKFDTNGILIEIGN